MAQTTGSITSREYTIQTSADGSSWVDHSGETVKVDPGAATRKTGETNTATGDLAIPGIGKRAAQKVAVEYLYTEGASDLFEIARTAFEAATDFYIRYAPKGGQTNEFLFTTLVGKISSFDYPPMDANSGDPVALGFELFTAGLVKSVAP